MSVETLMSLGQELGEKLQLELPPIEIIYADSCFVNVVNGNFQVAFDGVRYQHGQDKYVHELAHVFSIFYNPTYANFQKGYSDKRNELMTRIVTSKKGKEELCKGVLHQRFTLSVFEEMVPCFVGLRSGEGPNSPTQAQYDSLLKGYKTFMANRAETLEKVKKFETNQTEFYVTRNLINDIDTAIDYHDRVGQAVGYWFGSLLANSNLSFRDVLLFDLNNLPSVLKKFFASPPAVDDVTLTLANSISLFPIVEPRPIKKELLSLFA